MRPIFSALSRCVDHTTVLCENIIHVFEKQDWLKRGEKNSDIIESELSRESMTLKEWYTRRDSSTQSTQLQLQSSHEVEDDDPSLDNTSATLSVVVC